MWRRGGSPRALPLVKDTAAVDRRASHPPRILCGDGRLPEGVEHRADGMHGLWSGDGIGMCRSRVCTGVTVVQYHTHRGPFPPVSAWVSLGGVCVRTWPALITQRVMHGLWLSDGLTY